MSNGFALISSQIKTLNLNIDVLILFSKEKTGYFYKHRIKVQYRAEESCPTESKQ